MKKKTKNKKGTSAFEKWMQFLKIVMECSPQLAKAIATLPEIFNQFFEP